MSTTKYRSGTVCLLVKTTWTSHYQTDSHHVLESVCFIVNRRQTAEAEEQVLSTGTMVPAALVGTYSQTQETMHISVSGSQSSRGLIFATDQMARSRTLTQSSIKQRVKSINHYRKMTAELDQILVKLAIGLSVWLLHPAEPGQI